MVIDWLGEIRDGGAGRDRRERGRERERHTGRGGQRLNDFMNGRA